jgi:hypothetical protein
MKPKRRVEVFDGTLALALGTTSATVLLELQAVVTSKRAKATNVDNLEKN